MMFAFVKDDRLFPCTIYTNNPNFDVNTVIQMLDDLKEILQKEAFDIVLEDIKEGSLNLHVTIPGRYFVTKESLHTAIQSFLCAFFRAASIPYTQGYIYTVVLAESDKMVEGL